MPEVVVCGNLTLDDVVAADGAATMGVPGGNVLHAALGARLWTSSVGLVTRAGEDAPELSSAGQLDGVVRVPGPTVRCWVLYEADGRRTFVSRTAPSRYDEVALHADDVPPAWLDAHFVVAAMRLDAAEALVERVRGPVVLDTHEDWVSDSARVLALASRVTVFCPSRDELAELAGYDDPARSAPAIAAATGTPLVAKLGAGGCLVALPDGDLWTMPSVATEVVDPTGAGDAFCGGLAAGLARGLDVVEAARGASASAAFAVAGSGSLRFHELGEPPPLPEVTPVPASAASADGRSIGVMAGEIESIPRVISDQLERLDEPLTALVNELEERAIEHVYLTGCGDSAFAGQATALCFSRYAGVDARAVHALDLARYERVPERSAIVCVSYSGKVGRTIEAARRGFSIALTGGPDTPLAGECDRVLTMNVPTRGLSPGTSTYVAMVTALADFALHWGRGSRDTLLRAPELARATLEACWEPARALGRRLAGQRWICVVGGGPNEASARFGAAKFLEGAQVLGTATNVEEWAHEEYFVTRPGTPVIVVAPSGSVGDRALDVLEELAGIGADPVLVSDVAAPDGVTWLPLAPGLPEELSPLLAALPLSVVAFSLAEMTGKRSYNFASPEAEARHYRTIHAVGAAV